MDKGSRINYTEEQKRMLLQFFEEGMKSTKREMADKIRECSAKVGISEQQVKHWINNHNVKLRGTRSHEPKKSGKLMRKRSGFNAFTSDVLQKEQIGGGAEAFRTVGQKWRDLSESDKESYRKKAADSGPAVSMPSKDERARRIIRNIMKEVTELEALGGHYVLLCSFGGQIVHGGSAIGENLIEDKDLLGTFGKLIQLSHEEKADVSVKCLQELFNSKYSDLVQQKGKKMPYVKIGELGIVMEDLPVALAEEIGVAPRKPSFYGSSQRRKLWESRNVWKLGVSISTPSTSITTPSTSIFTPTSTSILSTSISSASIPSTSTSSTSISSTSIPFTTTPSASMSSTSIPSTSTSIPSTSIPSTSISSTAATSTSISSTAATSTSISSTSATSTSISSTPIPSLSTLSTSISSTSIPSTSAPSTSASIYSSAIPVTPGVIISKDTQLGMTMPNSSGDLYARCLLRPRSEIHGRAVLPGNVVVLVTRILRQGLMPLHPGRFDDDEPVSVGGFYEWPISQLVLL